MTCLATVNLNCGTVAPVYEGRKLLDSQDKKTFFHVRLLNPPRISNS